MNGMQPGWMTLLLLLAAVSHAADEAYTAEILKYRQDFDADVRTGGWLTGIGSFEIPVGVSSLGSGATARLRLPALHVPKSLGSLVRRADTVEFRPARGIHATVDDHALSSPIVLSMQKGMGRVRVGSVEFRARPFAETLYLFADDSANPALAAFAGSRWFPIDEAYRVPATFVPYDQPAETRLPLTHVASTTPMTSTGDIVFELGGRTVRLKTYLDDDNLFIMFSDPTNGHGTYGGGRFVNAPLPKDGKTSVDFNKAFSPYCSLSAYVYCPVVPPENRIESPVTAGEQFDGPEP